MKKFLYAVLIALAALIAYDCEQLFAADNDVLACRAKQEADPGLCAGSGCVCGMLKSECRQAKKWLRNFEKEYGLPGGMVYEREKYAYDQACKG
jgi:hypothetical protein